MLRDIAQQERTAIYIDGASFYQTARLLQIQVDYEQMRSHYATKYDLLRIEYFHHLVEGEEYSPVKPVLDWLAYNGYVTHIKSAREIVDANGRTRLRGNDVGIDIAVSMHELTDDVKHVVLFGGDADYTSLVKAMQRKSKRVSVISSIKTNPPTIADELRRQADQFFEFEEEARFFQRSQDEVRDRSSRARFEARSEAKQIA